MYKDKFVLSVLHNGSPVKETGSRYSRQVAIPFGSEYKLRLKNKNDRSCAVRLFIDGASVSNFGDFVVNAGGSVDLERFVTDSLTAGKKFKFVTLDHQDVDDPTKSENGLIRAEFRLAKQPNGVKITPWSPDVKPWPDFKPWKPWGPIGSDGTWWYETGEDNDGTGKPNADWSFTYSNSSGGYGACNYNSTGKLGSSRIQKKLMDSNTVHYSAVDSIVSAASFTEAGATVEGGHSGQSFGYANLEVDDHATILQLKIVGIKQQGIRTEKGKFCTQCGHRLRQRDKYCGGCGRKI